MHADEMMEPYHRQRDKVHSGPLFPSILPTPLVEWQPHTSMQQAAKSPSETTRSTTARWKTAIRFRLTITVDEVTQGPSECNKEDLH